MRIKICGLNPIRDVQICIDLKVDFLGFVFTKNHPEILNLTEVKNLLNIINKIHLLLQLQWILLMILLIKP